MIRGTNHDQDARFADKTKRMLEKSHWPDKYDIKVDLAKVDIELIKVWIEKALFKLLGEEDDITSGTIISIIEENIEKEEKLNAKVLHVAISGFLQEKTLGFVSQLWDILDEAQKSSRGIPECLLEEKLKSENDQRKKLEELNAKRYKINSNKFSNVINRFTNRRNQPSNIEDTHREEPRKRHRDRSRSRSKSIRKKKNQRGEKKRKHRSRSKEREAKRNKQKKRSPSSQNSQKEHKKEKKLKREKEKRFQDSDSSGVVSSS